MEGDIRAKIKAKIDQLKVRIDGLIDGQEEADRTMFTYGYSSDTNDTAYALAEDYYHYTIDKIETLESVVHNLEDLL